MLNRFKRLLLPGAVVASLAMLAGCPETPVDDTNTDSTNVTQTGDGDPSLDDNALRAFPSAQGWGTETPGGRGGKVYIVDTLNWDGPGSFEEAMSAREPRIIVFAVSGVIDVPPGGLELDESNSYVTVAGQTSPGGVTFSGSFGSFLSNYQTNFHDAVFRFIRIRNHGGYDNISFNHAHHLVFDHMDFSGATDEAFDVTYAHHVTVQWSTVTNSDTSGQGYGSLIAYPPTSQISLHHNLYAHHRNRCAAHLHWAGGGTDPDSVIDFNNNVVYNCAFDIAMYVADTGADMSNLSYNLIGNYLKVGPDTTANAYAFRLLGANLYFQDNQYPGREVFRGTPPNVLNQPATSPPMVIQSSDEAYELVLDRAGAFPRDAMNTRTVGEVRNGTGSLGNIDDPLLQSGPTPPTDADRDGMADDWETANGLNPADPDDGKLDADGDGYTNVEEYLNQLADSILPSLSGP